MTPQLIGGGAGSNPQLLAPFTPESLCPEMSQLHTESVMGRRMVRNACKQFVQIEALDIQ